MLLVAGLILAYPKVTRKIKADIRGDSIKREPNCLCHIYLKPDHIILKLSRYLENSTKNMIPTFRNILFNTSKDTSV